MTPSGNTIPGLGQPGCLNPLCKSSCPLLRPVQSAGQYAIANRTHGKTTGNREGGGHWADSRRLASCVLLQRSGVKTSSARWPQQDPEGLSLTLSEPFTGGPADS